MSEFFLSENFQFLEVNFSIYLNRLVFVMYALNSSGSLDIFLTRFSCTKMPKSEKASDSTKKKEKKTTKKQEGHDGL